MRTACYRLLRVAFVMYAQVAFFKGSFPSTGVFYRNGLEARAGQLLQAAKARAVATRRVSASAFDTHRTWLHARRVATASP